MAEVTTLLAHLVPKLTNRVEDEATNALAFILNKSAACRGALDHLLRDGDFNPEPIARVNTQVTDQDGSRPDMAGYDQEDVKRLLVEAKFWAPLGRQQASGYFGQLEATGPGVLLFIAPDSRIEPLWAEIRRQMEGGVGSVQLESMKTIDRTRRAKIAGSDKRVMLVSWDQLLGSIAASVADDTQVACDIQQLRGLVRYQDEEAFLPIHPEELGPAVPRRIQGLKRLIKDAVNASANDWTPGNSSATQDYFGRAFKFNDVPGSYYLAVSYPRWATAEETPLWLNINVPINAGTLRANFPSLAENERGRNYDVPIYLKTGVEYEAVLDDVVQQIRAIRNMID